jgi:hypothetical protein
VIDENDGILVIVNAVAEIPDGQTAANARFSRISNVRILNRGALAWSRSQFFSLIIVIGVPPRPPSMQALNGSHEE